MKLSITLPCKWNDLNTRQLKGVASLLHREISEVVLDYKVLRVLLDVRWWQLRKYWKFLKIIRSVEFANLKEHYQWFYNEVELTRFIPTLKGVYLAPFDRLSNFTVDEFSHTEDLYLQWYKTKNIAYLHWLVAVLYRENDTKTNKRLLFDKDELNHRSKLFAKLNTNTLLAVALSYQGCRTYITKQFPLVFPKGSATGPLPNNSGFGKLILHFSAKKFGTHNETKRTNLYTFLSEFEEQLKSKPYG